MFPIFRKELTSFFTTPVGYLVFLIFWILSGLFLWVFKGEFNILDFGFADLSPFFLLAPWLFMFLVPALSMKTFAEERKLGTLELLLSRPIKLKDLILGKFFGVFALSIAALIPSIIYVQTIVSLSMPAETPDTGLILGSYIGLLLLISLFAGIGVFASSLTDNQVVAFLVAVVINFIMYYGFERFSELLQEGGMVLGVASLGIKSHFENIGQGILDSRDFIYFTSLVLAFLFWTGLRINTYRV
ncbi:MAG: hypothetical protein RLZZ241_1790 [Bacteroidota bacterium]|jgi:ABC-2 type transport system permease protein